MIVLFRYDRLDELVKETGKKKNYLSIKMGYSSGRYLNDARKQNTNIKGAELQILADELNTTPEYLTGITDIKQKSPAPEGAELSEARMKLLVAIDGMSEDEVLAMVQMAEAAKKMRGEVK